MILKHRIYFTLRKYGINAVYQIQLRVTFDGLRWVSSIGCTIADEQAWDDKLQLVKEGYTGRKGETTISINRIIRECKERMENVFKYYEGNEIHPTLEQIVDQYQKRLSATIPPKPPKVKKEENDPLKKSLFEVFQLFVKECGEKNSWTKASYEKMNSLKEDLMTFKENLDFTDLTEATLTEFVVYLRDRKRLRTPRKKKGERKEYDTEDITGLKNTTIKKKLGFLKWFLHWATEHGYNRNLDFKTFNPTLKLTQRRIIFLTKDEIARIRSLDLTKDKAYLEPTRDVFLFCCFSGLRYSDAFNLRRSDIKGRRIEITTVKTSDSITIELNKVTTEILQKYKDSIFIDDKALPVMPNQTMNRNLKELCRLASITDPIRVTTYKGNLRHDEVKEKWQLIGTHTGRRTFIVNALSLGVPVAILMKWTGHAAYSSMKPYIDIVDSAKASEMTKLDSLVL